MDAILILNQYKSKLQKLNGLKSIDLYIYIIYR